MAGIVTNKLSTRHLWVVEDAVGTVLHGSETGRPGGPSGLVHNRGKVSEALGPDELEVDFFDASAGCPLCAVDSPTAADFLCLTRATDVLLGAVVHGQDPCIRGGASYPEGQNDARNFFKRSKKSLPNCHGAIGCVFAITKFDESPPKKHDGRFPGVDRENQAG